VSYDLFILPRAQKELAALPAEQLNIAERKIDALREDPRPAGCKKLAERRGWRIRFGNYRIIYKIDDAGRTVTIMNVGHRKEIYRG
jgi:mRNA interferase RelE/StbE